MKIKQTILYGALAVIFSLVLALAFTACGDDDDEHTHTWGAWRSNATQHWRECTANDGAKTDVANHTGNPCSVCGYDSLQNWTAVTDSTIWEYIFGTVDINAIAYGNGKFVAVGGQGKIATSANGAIWTAVEDSKFDLSYIYAIAYGSAGNAGNRFVAGGMNGRMAYSDDGENWSAVADSTFPSTDSSNGYSLIINAIAYGNNKLVAVGGDGKMAYSDDGETWAEVTDSTFPAESARTVDDEDPYTLTSSYRI
ncbi:MAG: hypothetical protein LBQ82_03355, partial [Treponema sp.]|nr:hypothetical protein [Treponema sp.]